MIQEWREALKLPPGYPDIERALQKYQEMLKASQAERQRLKEEVQITPP